MKTHIGLNNESNISMPEESIWHCIKMLVSFQ